VITEFNDILLDGQTVNVTVREGCIASISPNFGPAKRVILPLPVDPHVHLDKTFTIGRCQSAEPGLFGAIEAMAGDALNWTETDLRTRMTQALSEAYDNGIAAMRSHIDWIQADVPLAWEVLGELAQDWRGRVHIQRASLSPLDMLGDPACGSTIATRVARDNEVLGCFVYRNKGLDELLEQVFDLAAQRNLLLDFHVDEGLDIEADAFDRIVALTSRYNMAGRVLCGHACSLSIRPEAEVSRVLDAAAEAGIALTVLPNTNLWLQDSKQNATPRQRGFAPIHELQAAGVPVLFGTDNVADPFYRMGTYDALDVLRIASVAAHLVPSDWLHSITTGPARAMGVNAPEIKVGAPADFILIEGYSWDDALRDPRAQREIIRGGAIQPERKDTL